MSPQPAVSRPSPATLVLLGLVALLLWGRCAVISLFITDMPVPRYSVTRLDSLVAASPKKPATLYLTLELRNKRRHEFNLGGIYGEVIYKNHSWTAVHQYQHTGRAVGRYATEYIALALKLDASSSLPADSVQLLRRALQQGSHQQKSLFVRLNMNDFVYGKSSKVTLPLPALQVAP